MHKTRKKCNPLRTSVGAGSNESVHRIRRRRNRITHLAGENKLSLAADIKYRAHSPSLSAQAMITSMKTPKTMPVDAG
jgi:hypothetical protein